MSLKIYFFKICSYNLKQISVYFKSFLQFLYRSSSIPLPWQDKFAIKAKQFGAVILQNVGKLVILVLLVPCSSAASCPRIIILKKMFSRGRNFFLVAGFFSEPVRKSCQN
jgi:hypothetical protein